MKTKIPKPKKAYAIVNKFKPKFDALSIFKDKKEVSVWTTEKMCEVEIRFVKYIK